MTVHVVVAAGGPRGCALIDEVKRTSAIRKNVRFAGIISDNPSLSSRKCRYTWYEQFREYPEKIRLKAKKYNLPVFNDRVDDDFQTDSKHLSAFLRWLYFEAIGLSVPQLDNHHVLILMAGFGQRISNKTIKISNHWTINTHPIAYGCPWNTEHPFRGPCPWETMKFLDVTHAEIVAHSITSNFDCGREMFRVGPIKICRHQGKFPYLRLNQFGKRRICRPHDLGDFVLEMHCRAASYTKVIPQKIIVPYVIQQIQDGTRPDSSLFSSNERTRANKYRGWRYLIPRLG